MQLDKIIKLLPAFLAKGLPIEIRGNSGIGKTDMIRQMVHDLNELLDKQRRGEASQDDFEDFMKKLKQDANVEILDEKLKAVDLSAVDSAPVASPVPVPKASPK